LLHDARTRASKREPTRELNGPERTMNQITADINVVEAEFTDRQALATAQAEDSITDLNSLELALVGGGSISVILG
jgi:hypothetical protein